MGKKIEEDVRELVRPVVKLVVSLIVLGVIGAMVHYLPGLYTEIPGVPVSIAAFAEAIIAVLVILVILNFGREISPRVARLLPNFPESEIVIHNIILLIAIIVAYGSFKNAAFPFLQNTSWLYSLVFLCVAIIPTYRIAVTLFGNIEKITEMITKKITETPPENIRCPNCGTVVKKSKYCSNCGAKLEPAPKVEFKKKEKICSRCGAKNEPDAKYCSNCGARI